MGAFVGLPPISDRALSRTVHARTAVDSCRSGGHGWGSGKRMGEGVAENRARKNGQAPRQRPRSRIGHRLEQAPLLRLVTPFGPQEGFHTRTREF